MISNDSDFGISAAIGASSPNSPPWTLQAKISPATGKQDDGEYLAIDVDRLGSASGATTSTATVTISVRGS